MAIESLVNFTSESTNDGKLIVAAYMSSIYDDTPEGKSIVRLAKQMYINELPKDIDGTYKPLQLKLE